VEYGSLVKYTTINMSEKYYYFANPQLKGVQIIPLRDVKVTSLCWYRKEPEVKIKLILKIGAGSMSETHANYFI
jgi:hypothetical protein